MTERQYLGINENATVILNKDGTIKLLTLPEWKAYNAKHRENVAEVGCLPAGVVDVELHYDDSRRQDE